MRALLDAIGEVVQALRVQVREEARAEDLELNSYQWFMDNLADQRSTRVEVVQRMQPGKIHVFHYNPLHAATLDYFDTHPIVLHLGRIRRGTSVLELGLNITWWPRPARLYLVDRIREAYATRYRAASAGRRMQAAGQQPVMLDVYALRAALDHLGFSFAIRQYIPGRVLSEIAVVDYEAWERMVNLDTPRVFPELHGDRSLPDIRQLFYREVQRINQDRPGRLRRIEAQRRSGELYTFIDR